MVMAQPSSDQLLRLVQAAVDVHDLDTRVSHQFGIEHVAAARLVAVRVNGAKWVFESSPTSESLGPRRFQVLLRPPNAVLAVASALATLAILWPPFVVVAEGLTFHKGFFSIFAESVPGDSRGAVNVALLAIELITIAGVGAVLYVLALRVETFRSHERSN
jgi:hypothetical protein